MKFIHKTTNKLFVFRSFNVRKFGTDNELSEESKKKFDFFDRNQYMDRPYFLQPYGKNLSEYNYFTKKGQRFDLRRYPGDEEVLIDVEKFSLKEYIYSLLVPKSKKDYEEKDVFPYYVLFFSIWITFYLFFKKLKFHFFYNKEIEEMKKLEKSTGLMTKNFEGKEIFENVESSGFDYEKFEQKLRGMEWEVRNICKEIK